MTIVQVAEVQMRMAQLASLVAPPAVSGGTTGKDFATVLARALGAPPPVAADAGAGRGSTAGAVAPRPAGDRPGATGTAVAAPGRATGQNLVDAARAYLGVPYLWGGESLAEGGLDCSGLVQRSLADLGVAGVPRVARDQATLGTPVASLADALPGDLVVFGGGSHIGIYAGDGKMIDAPRPGKAVQLRDVYETPSAIRRVLPAVAAGPVGGAAPDAREPGREDLAAQQALAIALLGVAA